ncbi:hypothetical protein ACFORG_14955 [Lutimaribacter marinistellae]|uniref:Uncharacterized protein n=1 Tax=Lutimaribacter marinistellae TaxID=1820329 RepID=A0ABV7TJL1_9RHOB
MPLVLDMLVIDERGRIGYISKCPPYREDQSNIVPGRSYPDNAWSWQRVENVACRVVEGTWCCEHRHEPFDAMGVAHAR